MKIRMLETPKGRPEYQSRETYDFSGAEEGYARKFIARGWAEPADKSARDAAREDQERKIAEAAAKADQEARDRAAAEAKLKAAQGTAQSQS